MGDNTNVQMVCQFGQPARGLSPYGDSLLKALSELPDVTPQAVDYRAPYPGVLHPGSNWAANINGELHWANPLSWYKVARSKSDIVHIQHWSAPMAFYLATLAGLAKRSGKRVVVTVHNPSSHESLPLMSTFERRLFARADALVVHDKRGTEILRRDFGVSNSHIIAHGIDVCTTPPTPTAEDYAALGLDTNRRYFCIFGNLRGYKGVETLLVAWSKVVSRIPDLDLVIAGRLWSGKSGLASRIVARALGTSRDADLLYKTLTLPTLQNRVHLLEGFQSNENIEALLRISALSVFPYVKFSSQSGAACRAAGMGCPVLVSNIGGLPDLAINDQWLCEPGNSEALSALLHEKLTHPDALKSARAAQLKRVADYDWTNIAAAHKDLYCALIERRGLSKKH